MYRLMITGILPAVFVLPCLNQHLSYNEDITDTRHVEYNAGITSFSPIYSIETLDSVVHFEFTGEGDPNIGTKIFYFDDNSKLDSIKERFFDQTYNYTSGYTISYGYDEAGRVSDVFKSSWNSSIEHLAILIQEKYEYDNDFFRRFSKIVWQTAYDTSSVDVKEEYVYDDQSQLADYTLFVPQEINPDNAIYKEVYSYDTIGSLSYMSKDLSEAGESLNLLETKYQTTYKEQNMPWKIHTTSRKDGLGSWEESGLFQFFYDEMDRKIMLTETKDLVSDPIYERCNYSYDNYNYIIKKVRYISSDSVRFEMADSTLYYYSLSVEEGEENPEEEENIEEKEEEIPESPESLEFKMFPNPTDGILHITSGIDSPSTIKVIDASGKIILTRKTETGVADLDLSPYPAGFYIVTLTSIQGYHSGKVFKY
jgi:hypothetical protein